MNTDRFKFRVWNIHRKCYEPDADFWLHPQGELYKDDGYYRPTGLDDENLYCHPIDSLSNYIVEQCTGLKDANGKLIYEGDILCSQGGRKYIVEFYEDGARFSASILPVSEWKVFGVINACWIKDDEVRVIGNIHENHELLEGKK